MQQQLLQPIVATQTAHAPVLDYLVAWLTHAAQAPTHTITADEVNASGPFQTAKAPAISVASYVQRLALYTSCSSSAFVYAAVYMRRMAQFVPITTVTAHRCLPDHLTNTLTASPYGLLSRFWHARSLGCAFVSLSIHMHSTACMRAGTML